MPKYNGRVHLLVDTERCRLAVASASGFWQCLLHARSPPSPQTRAKLANDGGDRRIGVPLLWVKITDKNMSRGCVWCIGEGKNRVEDKKKVSIF